MMKIRINFLTGIVISIIWVVGATLVFVVYSFTEPVQMVTDNYYAEDLRYQEQIDKKARAIALQDRPSIISKPGAGIEINYPPAIVEEGPKGDILLYRPSNQDLDKRLVLELDSNGKQFIPANSLTPGYWELKLEWEVDGLKYLIEEAIVVS